MVASEEDAVRYKLFSDQMLEKDGVSPDEGCPVKLIDVLYQNAGHGGTYLSDVLVETPKSKSPDGSSTEADLVPVGDLELMLNQRSRTRDLALAVQVALILNLYQQMYQLVRMQAVTR